MDADEKLDSVPSLKQEGNQLFQVYNSGVYIMQYAMIVEGGGGGGRLGENEKWMWCAGKKITEGEMKMEKLDQKRGKMYKIASFLGKTAIVSEWRKFLGLHEIVWEFYNYWM